MNTIANNLITTKDIKIANQIFGPDIESLKEKITKNKPHPVIINYIDISVKVITTQINIVQCIDRIKVNGLLLLTTTSTNLCY